uniref:uncharacterized protein LOC122761915 isoform X2 n=1 Tax=Solea senegalensis TaxID=28829 RepID=UPI001CD8A3C0|nr:uncharacterized protein LOC122761915 isoform X2 [Solea senegalensis]
MCTFHGLLHSCLDIHRQWKQLESLEGFFYSLLCFASFSTLKPSSGAERSCRVLFKISRSFKSRRKPKWNALRRDKHISRCVSYGRHEGNQFHYNDTLRTLSVSYFAHEERPLTVVHYHCNPNQTASFIRAQSLSAEQPLQIWVESPCACPNACSMGDLGLGTIFLIILSLSAAAYFILGSCALRPFRSSSGVQMAPEHSVWCMMCYHCAERRPVRRLDTEP